MKPEDTKILTEFLGKCWHQMDCCPDKDCGTITYHCEVCEQDFEYAYADVPRSHNPDFTTPDGWQLIANEIGKRGEWGEFYMSIVRRIFGVANSLDAMREARFFHEKQPTDKSILILEAIKAEVFEEYTVEQAKRTENAEAVLQEYRKALVQIEAKGLGATATAGYICSSIAEMALKQGDKA